jgi:hypothetical protein
MNAIVPLFQSGSEFAACVAGLVQPQSVLSGSRSLSSEKLNMVSRGNFRLCIDGQEGSLGSRQEVPWESYGDMSQKVTKAFCSLATSAAKTKRLGQYQSV